MVRKIKSQFNLLETASVKFTEWVGTPYSIVLHTVLFVGIFLLQRFGFTTDQILLILTTAVSLEAIYLAIFIQMTVNRHAESLEDIEEDMEELSEDMDDDESENTQTAKTLQNIEKQLKKVREDLEQLKKKRINLG